MRETQSDSPISRRWVRYLVYALALTAIVVFALNTVPMVTRHGGNDLSSYLQSAKALIHGGDPYHTDSPFPYIYPLFLAMVLAPFSFFSNTLAHSLWFLLSLASLIYLTRRMIRYSRDDHHDFAKSDMVVIGIVCLLPLTNPIQNTLTNGQVNLLVLGCMVGFLSAYLGGRPRIAALLLGLAIAVKIVPIILIVFLLVRRQWRLALGALAVATTAVMLPYLLVGDRLFAMYDQYLHEFLLSNLSANKPHGQLTYSIGGLLGNFLPTDWPRPILNLSGVLLCAIPLGLVERTAIHCRRLGISTGHTEALSFSGYTLAILLLSPYSETHHLVFLIPLWIILSAPYVFAVSERRLEEGLLLLAFVVCFLTAGLLRSGTLYGVAILLLGTALVIRMNRLRC